jgi:PAS domain S-box-containing protein
MKDGRADITPEGSYRADLERSLDGSDLERRLWTTDERTEQLRRENFKLRNALASLQRRHGLGADRYEFAPMACCGLDSSGTVTDVNLAGAAMLGAPKASIVGRSLASFIQPPDREQVREHIRSCVARRVRTMTEARVLGEWGAETAVQIISAPLLSPEVDGFVLVTVIVDASSWAPLREVVHGLRNDLTTILLTATRALSPPTALEPHEARAAFDKIRLAAETMRQRLGAASIRRGTDVTSDRRDP